MTNQKQKDPLESKVDWESKEMKRFLALKGFTKAGYIKEMKRKKSIKLPGLRNRRGRNAE